jgi:predicted Zn-dependent peptidase
MKNEPTARVLLATLLAAIPLAAQNEISFHVREERLQNGLLVLLAPDRTLPLVSCQIYYRAGSRNEHTGITGIAHLFEHMMFNGAKRYGPKQFDAVLEALGGVSNAFTTSDYTGYFEEFPPAALDTVLDLESDRMQNLAISKQILDNEMSVVREERRLRTEDQPEGMAGEVFGSQLFMAHPYHWPVVGWMSDLNAIDVDDCRAFFSRYYHPGNATLVLVGDFDPDEAMKLVTKWFDPIKAGPKPPEVRTYDAKRRHETRTILRREAEAPLWFLGFQGPPGKSPDFATIDVLERVLTGSEGSRLTRRLVREEALALSVGMQHWWHIDPEPLAIVMQLRPGGSVARGEEVVWEEIEKLKTGLVTPAELERAKTGLVADRVRSLVGVNARGRVLGLFQTVVGDWRHAFALPGLYEAVTAEQIREVAKKYFDRHVSTTLVLEPTKEQR